MFIDDTIAAIATATGEGGIGIIRISGMQSLEIAKKVRGSFAFRNQSERLINLAKSVVEYAIEKDEEKAIKWLKEKGVDC